MLRTLAALSCAAAAVSAFTSTPRLRATTPRRAQRTAPQMVVAEALLAGALANAPIDASRLDAPAWPTLTTAGSRTTRGGTQKRGSRRRRGDAADRPRGPVENQQVRGPVGRPGVVTKEGLYGEYTVTIEETPARAPSGRCGEDNAGRPRRVARSVDGESDRRRRRGLSSRGSAGGSRGAVAARPRRGAAAKARARVATRGANRVASSAAAAGELGRLGRAAAGPRGRSKDAATAQAGLDDARSTFKSRAATKKGKNKYLGIFVVLLFGSFVIPMAQYFWYVRDTPDGLFQDNEPPRVRRAETRPRGRSRRRRGRGSRRRRGRGLAARRGDRPSRRGNRPPQAAAARAEEVLGALDVVDVVRNKREPRRAYTFCARGAAPCRRQTQRGPQIQTQRTPLAFYIASCGRWASAAVIPAARRRAIRTGRTRNQEPVPAQSGELAHAFSTRRGGARTGRTRW